MIVASEAQALLIEQLLGSTLASIVKAQSLVASQVAEIVRTVGFEEDPQTKELKPRTFTFSFTRSEVDPASGTVVQQPFTATVPLLSIVSLPAIAIEEARVEMEVRIVAHGEATATSKALPAPTGVRTLPLYAVPARRVGATADGGVQATGSVRVSVLMKRLEPVGMDRLNAVLDGAFHEEPSG